MSLCKYSGPWKYNLSLMNVSTRLKFIVICWFVCCVSWVNKQKSLIIIRSIKLHAGSFIFLLCKECLLGQILLGKMLSISCERHLTTMGWYHERLSKHRAIEFWKKYWMHLFEKRNVMGSKTIEFNTTRTFCSIMLWIWFVFNSNSFSSIKYSYIFT